MAKAKKAANTVAGPVTQSPGRKFKVLGNVTMPVFTPKIEEPAYVKVLEPMYLGKEMKAGSDGQKKAPATLCKVVDLETGEVKLLIVAAVVKGIFEDNYPGNAYVGKAFCLVKHAKKEGKNYFNFSVDEIDPDAPTESV